MTLVHELQGRAPTGMKYNITLIEKEKETTLEEVLYSRGRSGVKPVQRRKINMHSQIITQQQCINEMSGHESQMKPCKKKKGLKRERDAEPLSETTTDEEFENIVSDSADDVSFTLDKDVNDIYKFPDEMGSALLKMIENDLKK